MLNQQDNDMISIYLLGTPYLEKDLQDIINELKVDFKVEKCPNDIHNITNSVIIYCCNSAADKSCIDNTEIDYLLHHNKIFPVIKNLNNCERYIPSALSRMNAMKVVGKKDIPSLINRILVSIDYIEPNRKVFISYKRTDSTKLAHKLYDNLIKNRFIPFLDSYSIDAGVDFQQYLMHELSDSAFFIFINTKHYQDSEYTVAELNACNRLQLAVMEIRTADAYDYKESRYAATHVITDANKVSKREIDKIIGEIEYVWCQFATFRKKVFEDILKSKNMQEDTKQNAFVNKETKDYYFPIYHIPSSFDYEKINNKKLPLHNSKAIYNGLYCRQDIKKHIKWLNDSLPVQAQDINEL